jgi:cytochrome c oxidase assembly factor CtaG
VALQDLRGRRRLEDACAGTSHAVLASMQQRTNRYLLGSLLAFLALNAFAGGCYALAGAEGVPVEWLQGSAFPSYFVPGLILFLVVGGTAVLAATAVLARHRRGFDLAKRTGWILITWLIVQLVIIGFVSWLQPATAVAAIAILWLAYRPEPLRSAWRTS